MYFCNGVDIYKWSNDDDNTKNNSNNNPHCTLHSSSAGSQISTEDSHQANPLHCCAKISPTTLLHVLSITDIWIYRAGRRLSSFRVSVICFVILLAVDSTGATIQGVFSCHILIRSSFKSVHFWTFSVMVLWRLWLLGIVTSVEYFELLLLLITSFQLLGYPLFIYVFTYLFTH